MFTLSQIKAAHAKVKSGADFPTYVQEILSFGVKGYITFLSDGHSEYYGDDNYSITSPAGNFTRQVPPTPDIEKFTHYLRIHQQGQTDFTTFCNDAAATGVKKWNVDFGGKTCTYYDTAGNTMLVENIGNQ